MMIAIDYSAGVKNNDRDCTFIVVISKSSRAKVDEKLGAME